MNWTGVAVFAVTYVLISARRLSWLGFDRPAGALFGAVACVALGVLSPERALQSIHGPTLLLLFGVMGMGACLALDGFFDVLESAIVRRARTPARLLAAIVWGAGLLSAFLTNDAVCVLAAPIVVRLVRRHDLPPLPYLLALATAANTGSVGTLVGNPQNMLCASLGGLSYRDHLVVAFPLALVCLAANHAILHVFYRRQLARTNLGDEAPPRPLGANARITLGVIVATAVAYTLGADLAWSATTGLVALMLLHRRDTTELWSRIDWSLLIFFSGLFVVVEGLVRSGATTALFSHYPLFGHDSADFSDWLRTAGVFLVGSNAVSNVPFILVVRDQMAASPDKALGWEVLAMASTFAGNLTLLGSAANIIVAESARPIGGIGFFEHLKVGLPVALVTTLIGVVWLYAFFH
ncbi:MAG: anion permease [Planctomycetes bacterium]|nr:anion permease [Planctomycetota bacterium]MCB9918052.1 anion permease [Planctomycetota bacterium]